MINQVMSYVHLNLIILHLILFFYIMILLFELGPIL